MSPSRQRKVGDGTMPLTAVATLGRPVTLNGIVSIVRSKEVPESSLPPVRTLPLPPRT